MPTVNTTDTLLTARRRRVYSNAHAYHINSISLNSDCETYISADDLRVNLVRQPVTFRLPPSPAIRASRRRRCRLPCTSSTGAREICEILLRQE